MPELALAWKALATSWAIPAAFLFFGIPQLPLVLGVVLGFMVESNYRRALVLSSGDHSIFVQDPISLGLL
ncbi:MAG TPA: hypothetical protein VJM14_07390, partial [Burkholderiales bacterium]|nr:hypothetical protein [Burkholderiales bacterium]